MLQIDATCLIHLFLYETLVLNNKKNLRIEWSLCVVQMLSYFIQTKPVRVIIVIINMRLCNIYFCA